MQDDLIPFIPFEKLRGRTLVWCFFLTSILSGFFHYAIGWMLFHVIFLICISPILFRSRLSYKQLFGVYPTWSMLGWYTLWVFPLLIFSLIIFYLQYLPLHYLYPEFANWWFYTFNPSIPISTGEGSGLVYVCIFIAIVLIAPIIEEFFVRGILLTRWTIKWGTPKAILVSSLIFGILHANVIGGFFFGYVLSILYIRTKSLFIPICIHIGNNLIACVIDYVLIPLEETLPENEQILLEGSDWIQLTVATLIILPWAINLVIINLPKNDWRVPYLADAQLLR